MNRYDYFLAAAITGLAASGFCIGAEPTLVEAADAIARAAVKASGGFEPDALAPERHPDIFRPEAAVAYLHLESVRSLETLREDFQLQGYRAAGKSLMYHREDLDACAEAMFGRSSTTVKRKVR